MKTVYGWVIENGQSDPSHPLYWAGGGKWNVDSNEAIRFMRQDDASRVACHLTPQLTLHRIAEHGWDE
jgi:hypothetical protein